MSQSWRTHLTPDQYRSLGDHETASRIERQNAARLGVIRSRAQELQELASTPSRVRTAAELGVARAAPSPAAAPHVRGPYEALTPDARARLRAEGEEGEKVYQRLRADWERRGCPMPKAAAKPLAVSPLGDSRMKGAA